MREGSDLRRRVQNREERRRAMKTRQYAGLLFATLLVCGAAALAAEEPKATGEQGAIEERTPGQSREALTGEEAATGVLTLDEDLAGEIFIYDAERRLVTKLLKEEGRPVDVRLEPGRYEVEWEPEPGRLSATLSIACGERLVVDREAFRGEPRADDSPFPPSVERRMACRRVKPGLDLRSWRLTFDSGLWIADGAGSTSFVATDHGFRSEDGGFLGGVSVGYRLSPEWMVDFSAANRIIEAVDAEYGTDEDIDRVSMISTLSVGARYYLPPLAARSSVKPYVRAALGPSIGFDIESRHDDSWHHWHDSDSVRTTTVLGGQVGAGVDIHATNWLVLGSDVTYHLVSKFSEAVGGHKDASGFTFTFQIGTAFGRRVPARASR
jgi:outer membrane protein W